MAFDLDKNKFVGAAEIRHVLVNIGEQVINVLIRVYGVEVAPCRMRNYVNPKLLTKRRYSTVDTARTAEKRQQWHLWTPGAANAGIYIRRVCVATQAEVANNVLGKPQRERRSASRAECIRGIATALSTNCCKG